MMKRLILTGFLGCILGTACLFGSVEDFEVIKLRETTEEALQRCFSGKGNVVVHLSAGENFPVNMTLAGDFFVTEEGEQSNFKLRILRDCYLRVANDEFQFSEDLQVWQGFMEFFTGEFGFGVNVKTEVPQIYLHAIVNART